MMARSKRSNQRPDTLMQDRSPPTRRNPLATHGRTIHLGQSRRPQHVGRTFRYSLNSARIVNMRDLQRCSRATAPAALPCGCDVDSDVAAASQKPSNAVKRRDCSLRRPSPRRKTLCSAHWIYRRSARKKFAAGRDTIKRMPSQTTTSALCQPDVWGRTLRFGAIALFLAAPAALNTAQSGAALGQTTEACARMGAVRRRAGYRVCQTRGAGRSTPTPDGAKFTAAARPRARRSIPPSARACCCILPGGPGAGITEMMGGDMRDGAAHRRASSSNTTSSRFDPRGIGKSSPIRCDPDAVPPGRAPLDRQPTQAEFDAMARANAALHPELRRRPPASCSGISPPWTPPRTSSASARR